MNSSIEPLRRESLPLSEALRKAGNPAHDARFFAVSEALSLPAIEIGPVQPTADAANVRRRVHGPSGEFICKDQV